MYNKRRKSSSLKVTKILSNKFNVNLKLRFFLLRISLQTLINNSIFRIHSILSSNSQLSNLPRPIKNPILKIRHILQRSKAIPKRMSQRPGHILLNFNHPFLHTRILPQRNPFSKLNLFILLRNHRNYLTLSKFFFINKLHLVYSFEAFIKMLLEVLRVSASS